MVDLEECDDEDVAWLERAPDPAPGRDRLGRGDPDPGRVAPRRLRFAKVMPRDYKRVLEAMRGRRRGRASAADEAIMAAAHG